MRPEKHTTSFKRREALYHSVEWKIQILKDLWRTAQKLPIALPIHTPPQVEKEERSLNAIYEQAVAQNPLAAEKTIRAQEITEKLKERYSYNQFEDPEDQYKFTEEDVLDKELSQLQKDPDVEFLTMLNNGIKAAIGRRAEIREVLEVGNGPGKLAFYIPAGYEELFQGNSRIVPGRFSIAMYVDQLTFDDFIKRILGPESKTKGFHISDTPWTAVRISILEDIEMNQRFVNLLAGLSAKKPKKVKQGINKDETVSHEDFHAFAEGFLETQIKGYVEFNLLRSQVRALGMYKEQGREFGMSDVTKILVAGTLQDIYKGVIKLTDADRDELLAEFVSIKERSERPTRTFASLMLDKRKQIEQFRGIHPRIDAQIDAALNILDIDKLRVTIKSLYDHVAEKTPERREDLDAAFVLFPISQIRHIERLVARWTQ